MTPLQLRRHFMPAWSRAFAAIWRTENGRVIRHEHARRSAFETVVTKHAEARARREHRGVTADDLRHGCVIASIGRDKSAHDLNWRETEQVVALFEILKRNAEDIDEVDLQRVELEDLWCEKPPKELWRRAYIRLIRACAPQSYITNLAKSIHGTCFWEDMSFDRIVAFHDLIRKRRKFVQQREQLPLEPSAKVPYVNGRERELRDQEREANEPF